MRQLHGLIVSSLCAVGLASAAEAGVINVQMERGDGAISLDGTTYDSTVAPVSYTNTSWNVYSGSAFPVSTLLVDSTGASTGVTGTLSGLQGIGTNLGTGVGALLSSQGYGDQTHAVVYTLNNLDSTQTYDLYVASYAAGTTLGGDVTVTGTVATNKTCDKSQGSSFVDGVNYMSFLGVAPLGVTTSDGTITVTGNSVGGYSIVNGMQIVTAVPEPTSLSLLALGGMAMFRRRR